MTKSIFEKMTLTKYNEEALEYATSDRYIKKVINSETKKDKRLSIRSKQMSSRLRDSIATLQVI